MAEINEIHPGHVISSSQHNIVRVKIVDQDVATMHLPQSLLSQRQQSCVTCIMMDTM